MALVASFKALKAVGVIVFAALLITSANVSAKPPALIQCVGDKSLAPLRLKLNEKKKEVHLLAYDDERLIPTTVLYWTPLTLAVEWQYLEPAEFYLLNKNRSSVESSMSVSGMKTLAVDRTTGEFIHSTFPVSNGKRLATEEIDRLLSKLQAPSALDFVVLTDSRVVGKCEIANAKF